MDDLSEIRNMMERASKFISLSGISGIMAGLIALLGSIAAWWYLYRYLPNAEMPLLFDSLSVNTEPCVLLSLLAFSTFTGAFLVAVYFTTRISKKKKVPIWDYNTKRILLNLMIPVVVGAFFIFALIYYRYYILIIPASLIFYGLSLINGSHFTYSDIKFLGYLELVLGLLSLMLIDWGIFIWAFGFGILHITYGIIMYFKYEK